MEFVKRNKYLPLIGLLIICLAFLWLTLTLFLPTKLLPSSEENFIVGENYSQAKIVNKLWQKNLIRNKTIFRFFLKRKNTTIQPGAYFLSKNMSIWQTLNILSKLPSEIWITIPEGLRKEQVCSILQEKLKWGPETTEHFLKISKEGYLFPETYLFDRKTSPQIVMQKLNNQLHKEYIYLSNNTDNTKQENKIIIIASLIQREAQDKQAMQVISGIIQNRLKASMPLNIDAALQYMTGTSSNWWPNITNQTKKIDSPFNTYRYKGLPPSPISNPGKESIMAALYPAQTNYFYYLYDSKGAVHYAKTYRAHLENIKKYLQDKTYR